MGICWIFKKLTKYIWCQKPEQGYSLIELLIAMLVLILIVFAFTPLLVGSIDRIHFAGDKSEALYEGQSDIEVNIAERIKGDGGKLVFTFTNPDEPETTIEAFDVPGDLIYVEKEKGRASAWLSGFVPYVSTMSLNPSIIIEGYDDGELIEVEGKFTDFNKADEINIAESLDLEHDDPDVYSFSLMNISSDPDNNKETAEFYLNKGLTNSKSPYIAFCRWKIESDEEIWITVRARLYVSMPKAVAVGTGQRIIASTNARDVWNEKDHDLSGTGRFTDIIWTGSEYFASSVSGRVAEWKNREEPRLTDENYNRINSVAHGDRKYLAAGSGGKIYVADNIKDFFNEGIVKTAEIPQEAESIDFNSVIWGGERFVAAGGNGTILYSSDPTDYIAGWDLFDWGNENNNNEEESFNTSGLTFTGIAYGGNDWIAVGYDNEENAVAVRFNPQSNEWEDLTLYLPSSDILNDIAYAESKFIAVGNNGTIVTTDNGLEWDDLNSNNNLGSEDLYVVEWGYIGDETGNIDYIIAGADGRIITSAGEGIDNLIMHQVDTDITIYGAALRWTP